MTNDPPPQDSGAASEGRTTPGSGTVCAVLAIVIFGVFGSLFRADFVGYDDGEYFYQNQHVTSGLSGKNIAWAFTATAASNWHPLTWISHMLDAQVFGVRAGGAHFMNALLHAANSALLFVLLNRMTGARWRSAFVAALFALHPLHVESVAWISERKDVLSAFFFMLTLLAYVRYAKCQAAFATVEKRRRASLAAVVQNFLTPAATKWYILALLFFALGLMSKPMLVTLPFVLVLLDYWPLGRIKGHPPLSKALWRTGSPKLGALLIEKWPFFLLTAGSCVVTYFAQEHGGAVETLEHVPLCGRLANAVAAYGAYLAKMMWPAKLAILYLRPDVWPAWQLGSCAVALAGLSYLALKWAVKRPYFFVGWFWYLGMLVPVIGLV